MKLRLRLGACIAALLPLAMAPPAAADPIAEQKRRVQLVEQRIDELQSRMAGLLSEVSALDSEMQSTHSSLGASYLRLESLKQRSSRARAEMRRRARESYKEGGFLKFKVILGAESIPQVLTISRALTSSMQRDAAIYDELLAAERVLQVERKGTEAERADLMQAEARMKALKIEISETLGRELADLQKARAELGSLEAARRARIEAERRRASVSKSGSGVSAAVEARRAARQLLLDARLASLLAWYAPGSGPEPFMPPRLRSTGIVTHGLSSWYGPGFDGRRASSGATYRQEQLTAASLVLPFGTLLKVSLGNRSAVVVITDRGPYIPGRVLDLSMGAADALGLRGVKEVRMEILVPKEPAPPFP